MYAPVLPLGNWHHGEFDDPGTWAAFLVAEWVCYVGWLCEECVKEAELRQWFLTLVADTFPSARILMS